MTYKERKIIEQMLRSGKSIGEICNTIHKDQATIHYEFRRAGMTRKNYDAVKAHKTVKNPSPIIPPPDPEPYYIKAAYNRLTYETAAKQYTLLAEKFGSENPESVKARYDTEHKKEEYYMACREFYEFFAENKDRIVLI